MSREAEAGTMVARQAGRQAGRRRARSERWLALTGAGWLLLAAGGCAMDVDEDRVAGQQAPLPVGGGGGWGFPNPWPGGGFPDKPTVPPSDPPGPVWRPAMPSACVEGVEANGCVAVPPRQDDRGFAVDAQMGVDEAGRGEYYGAVQLPYTHEGARRSGRLWVTATGWRSGQRKLRLYGEVPVQREEHGTRPESRWLAVALDLGRYAREPVGLQGRDLRVKLDLWGGAPRWEAASWRFGIGSWAPTGRRGSARVRCEPRAELGVLMCRFEVMVRLSAADLRPSAEGLSALGLAVAELPGDGRGARWERRGGMPKELWRQARRRDQDIEQVLLDRSQYVTLLLREPPSVPLKVATFNVVRFGKTLDWLISNTVFREEVALEELAEQMYRYDAVGLQELWTEEEAVLLLKLVNRLRRAEGLEPMRSYGPPVWSDEDREAIEARVREAEAEGERVEARTDANGGVYLFTSLPVLAHSFMVYEACRGEDCFKPKGALWARLGLHPTLGRACEAALKEPCGAPATGDEFVDVFVTHLQAKKPKLCVTGTAADYGVVVGGGALAGAAVGGTAGSAAGAATGAAAGAVVAPVLVWAVTGSPDAYCAETTDWEVQARQLGELSSFVDRVASPDRPALLLGDFNIDGRRLGASTPEENVAVPPRELKGRQYTQMLRLLGVVDASAVGADELAPADWTSGRPEAFAWDVDHGDVARHGRDHLGRERTERFWLACGVGTFVGKGGEDVEAGESQGKCRQVYWTEPSCQERGGRYQLPPEAEEINCEPQWAPCDLPGDKRLDYILVRPPRRADGTPYVPSYLLGLPGEPSDPVWQARFPDRQAARAEGILCGGPGTGVYPTRSSDHRLVEASLRLMRLRLPQQLFPEWTYRMTFRVVSYDATGVEDCATCGKPDIYPVLSMWGQRGDRPMGYTDPIDAWNPAEGPSRGRYYCDGQYTGAYPSGCMKRWKVVAERLMPSQWVDTTVRMEVWDYDDFLAWESERYAVVDPPKDLRWHVKWSRSNYRFTNERRRNVQGWGDKELPLLTTDPIAWCSEGATVSACVRIEWEEVR